MGKMMNKSHIAAHKEWANTVGGQRRKHPINQNVRNQRVRERSRAAAELRQEDSFVWSTATL